MKSIKNIIPLVVLIAIAAVSCEKEVDYSSERTKKEDSLFKSLYTGEGEDGSFSTALIAGKDIEVSRVIVWNDRGNLFVKYLIENDLTPGDLSDDGALTLITETHLAVSTSLEAIPLNRGGNPKVGKYEYSTDHSPGVSEYTYEIENTWERGTVLTISAHAVVEKTGGIDGLEISLPVSENLNVYYPGTSAGDPCYFDAVVSGGTMLDGIYDSWCIDTDHIIYSGPNYTYLAEVYSSYEEIPDGVLEQPENMDLINWVINQGFVGKPSLYPDLNAYYTMGDVQVAIWTLADDEISTSVGPYSMTRVDEIVAAAMESGEEFIPECTERIAVIIVPVSGAQVTIAQVTFIEVKLPCETIKESAWGQGPGFRGKNWASYFEYILD